MDPVDPKRRGRRLFGGRRRHEHPAEAEMNEHTATAEPEASTPGPAMSDSPGEASYAGPEREPSTVDTIAGSSGGTGDDLGTSDGSNEAADDPAVIPDPD